MLSTGMCATYDVAELTLLEISALIDKGTRFNLVIKEDSPYVYADEVIEGATPIHWCDSIRAEIEK